MSAIFRALSSMTEDGTHHRAAVAFQGQLDLTTGNGPNLCCRVLAGRQHGVAILGKANRIDRPQMITQHMETTATGQVPNLCQPVPTWRNSQSPSGREGRTVNTTRMRLLNCTWLHHSGFPYTHRSIAWASQHQSSIQREGTRIYTPLMCMWSHYTKPCPWAPVTHCAIQWCRENRGSRRRKGNSLDGSSMTFQGHLGRTMLTTP